MRRILYILCPGHSGSTLLTLALATHPEVATIGERHYLKQRLLRKTCDDNLCLCGRRIPECDYLADLFQLGKSKMPWPLRNVDYPHFLYSNNLQVDRLMRRVLKQVDFGRQPGIVSWVLSTPARHLLRANLAIIDRVLELENGSVFLDGSKSTAELLYLNADENIKVTLIHLSRDGRGQFHSMKRVRPHLSDEEVAHIFYRWHGRITRVIGGFSGDVIRVKYEDFCDRPIEELRRIAEEAGLDPAGMTLEWRSGAGHAIGNERLMGSDTTQIKNKETWRSELTAEQFETFDRIAGDANRDFGYTD